MLVHQTRELVVCHGQIERRKYAGERVTVAVLLIVFIVRAEDIATGFNALVVLFAKKKALHVQEFARVGFEGGHARDGD